MMNQELTTDAIRDMYAEGMSSAEIGNLYGVTSSAVRTRALRAGIVNPRGPGGPYTAKTVEDIALDMKPMDAVEYLLGVVQELEQVVVRDDVLALDIHLTPAERKILSALMNSNGALSKDALLSAACYDRHPNEDFPDVRLVAVYICKIRQKLPPEVGHIETVWGDGYRFVRAS